ncbi:hypothetical protein F2P81_010923 [Scophthalmus maximus]|uniref:Teneurin N-terminal domain-containing protein n=1 Tax=Scophthalmus maximus TaxID=52904 RepID=A0A6A4SZ94_SCOMX|nr:hypothetical protein F2P81_010923 [Scophthalmus maximus]
MRWPSLPCQANCYNGREKQFTRPPERFSHITGRQAAIRVHTGFESSNPRPSVPRFSHITGRQAAIRVHTGFESSNPRPSVPRLLLVDSSVTFDASSGFNYGLQRFSQVESHSVRPPSLRLRPPSALLSVYAAVQQHAYMFATGTSRSIMEVKERRPYCSLTKGRKDKEGPYTVDDLSNLHPDSTDTVSNTFYTHCIFPEQIWAMTGIPDIDLGQHFSLRQLGICEPPSRRGLAFCSEMGLPHRGFSVGTAPDLDMDSQAVMSPERAMRLWGHGALGKSSGRSSCLSSRSNSVLTLTDTEHENKSDSDNGTENQTVDTVSVELFLVIIFRCMPRHWSARLVAPSCDWLVNVFVRIEWVYIYTLNI